MKHSQPSWDEIKVMARISGISLQSVTPICGRILKDILTGIENRQLLEPVTSQIRELLAVDSGDNKIQKQYTVCGFFVALLGILFATYAYFRPLPPPPAL